MWNFLQKSSVTLHPIPPLESLVLTETPVKRRGQNKAVFYTVKNAAETSPRRIKLLFVI